MRAPGFWWRSPPSALAWLLQPFGALYGAITLQRMRRPGAQARIPVICVGNFVAGGAGKTPTTLALASRLAALGEMPFALTRGYGGRLPTWMKVGGVGQLKATLAEVVIVVLIVIFARVVVEAQGKFEWSMLVLPASILMIAVALRMIELGGKVGKEEDGAH